MERRVRRSAAMSLTMLAVALSALAMQWAQNSLGDSSLVSGWTLLAATAGLYLLTLRKRLVHPRWGSVAVWLQVHSYMGTFASIVFLMHIGWPIRGVFESCLAAAFVFVAVTGIVLGIMSRTTPRRLAALAVDQRLDRIPLLQAAIAKDAHHTALVSAGLGEGATLAEFYQRRLLPFFHSPRHWAYRLAPNGALRRRLLRELEDLDRYLAAAGRDQRSTLTQLVKTKDDLDYQYALQTRLQYSYALHVALTWSLMIMIVVHVVLVYRFQGAAF